MYFKGRILRHARGRVASHPFTYKCLLFRMPGCAADNIKVLDNGLYAVPGATNSTTYYELSADVGACTCFAGIQKAFCKHQVMVHGKCGGFFLMPLFVQQATGTNLCS
ncbi:hypothetical protein MRX96_043738 [Rhipicephalus microplus]